MSILGRIFIEDVRDQHHPMADMIKDPVDLAEEMRRRENSRYWWADGWWGDQFYTSECVAYSWAHWLEDGPITHHPKAPQREAQHETGALISPNELYTLAQEVDEWPGEDYEGTSVRAGAKILQRWGYISAYGWAWDVPTIVDAIMTTGPVVVGTNWYESMFYPTKSGRIRVDGQAFGGHAYVLNGVNKVTREFRIKNSWGRNWGYHGFAYIGFDDMARLIDEHGEACLADEVPSS